MDTEPQAFDESSETSHVGRWLVVALIALFVGVLLGRFVWPTGEDVEIVTGELGVVSDDLDSVALQGSNDSWDLSHASNVECLEGLERGTTIHLGVANLTTGEVDTPDIAYLNSPEAEVVLWVECTSPATPIEDN